MSNTTETVFADGFFFKEKHANAPDFVVGSLSCKVADAISFLSSNANGSGYVNMQIKMSKGGKPYVALDTFTPKPKSETAVVEDGDDPF